MIRSEKREFILIAAIALLVLLAVVPLGSAITVPIFEDDFASGNLDNWNKDGSVKVITGGSYQPPWGGYYVTFNGSNSDFDDEEIWTDYIDTTCMKNITLSFARRTVKLNDTGEWFRVRYDIDSGDFKTLAQYNDSLVMS